VKTPNSPRALASRLAVVARGIRDQGGDSEIATHRDLRAQTLPYAYLLRRWDNSVDIEPLVNGFTDEHAIAAIETVLDDVDTHAVRACYEAEGKDAAIYFYEEFLRAYDGANARARGVHYSPPEVVSCIVRGAHSILRRSFGSSLDDALVVDPCCGVGTFLRHIERETRYHPRMIGMELMPAPFAIASCLLRSAQVLHADWLSQTEIDTGGSMPVIIGNPPYSGHSSNPGKLAEMMADYREGLNERNPKWLQDDYVKFIRMAQHQIESAGRGIIAFITNHSYLTNPTFRGMRESLARTFDEILVLDLHGNVKRHDGRDQNIFPIQMGVAISFFVKTSDKPDCAVRYFSIDGSREDKLEAVRDLDLANVPWSDSPAAKPFRLFTPHDSDLTAEFNSFPSLFDIFHESTIGFVTSRDRFAIGFTREEVLERVSALRDATASDTELRETYRVGDLDIESARRTLQNDPDWQSKTVEVLYRPFDRRWAYYSRAIMERPRLPFMQNLMEENFALAIGRAGNVTGSEQWDVAFCTDRPADLNLFRRGGAKLFPRYIYGGLGRLSNIAINCADPDALLAYIYGILNSTAYKTRYAEFLRIDYPRIPITHDTCLFKALADLGKELIDAHLMRSLPSPQPSPQRGEGVTLRIGGYGLPTKCLKDRAGVDSADQVTLVESLVAGTIELRKRVDEIIAQAPPWDGNAAAGNSESIE